MTGDVHIQTDWRPWSRLEKTSIVLLFKFSYQRCTIDPELWVGIVTLSPKNHIGT
jgi:hypothetical protein